MQGPRVRYRVMETYPLDRVSEPEVLLFRGQTVYELIEADYGMAADHTRLTNEPHISVSLSPDGRYPFVTVPTRILRRCLSI